MHESGADGAGDEVDWASVREAYEAGQVPVSRICADHGITRGRLRYRCLAEGWKVRPRVALPGQPTLMRRAIEVTVILIARLIEEQIERLLTVPEGAGAPPPVAEGQLNTIADLGKVAEGWMREDWRRRQAARTAAGRKTSAKPALDGGQRTKEEARAADVAFMRAELKRRLDVLARSRQEREGPPDRRSA